MKVQVSTPLVRREAPDPSLYRLSLYHCLLGELLRTGAPQRITSRQIADMLDLKEETVRRDISFIGEIGRPGAGYVPRKMYEIINEYLGLGDVFPIVLAASAPVFEASLILAPLDGHGMKVEAVFSERPEDVGREVAGHTLRSFEEIEEVVPKTGAQVAGVATAAGSVQDAVDRLARAGITGIFLMTAMVAVERPADVRIRQIRIPCDIKSLAGRANIAACLARPAKPLPDTG